MLPSQASAIWDLPAGSFSYAEFHLGPGDVEFNVRPDQLVPAPRAALSPSGAGQVAT